MVPNLAAVEPRTDQADMCRDPPIDAGQAKRTMIKRVVRLRSTADVRAEQSAQGTQMQFTSVDGFLCVARTTGPRHNLLQLKLSKVPGPPPNCEELPSVGKCNHGELNPSKITDAVKEGIAAANAKIGTMFHPVHIRYVANDTGPEDVYRILAEALVLKVATGELEVE